MPEEKKGFRQFFREAEAEPEFWKNSRHMEKTIHGMPNSYQALLLELDVKPMTLEEITLFFENLRQREPRRRHGKIDIDIKKCLEKCITLNVIVKKESVYFLTDGGKEIAAHFKKVIPLFITFFFSSRTVSKITIAVHAVLSIMKFVFGFLSRSSGLISDGIDNCIDTAASIGIWIGIKYKKERFVSLAIIIMMFISVAGILYMGVGRFINPVPVHEGATVFIVSLLCGFVMLGLSAYQYLAGKRTSNFTFLCQAVDSRNHFITSLLVCSGIALSYAAGALDVPFLYYGDAAAACIIGGVIAKSAVELIVEYAKGGQADTANIRHFMGTSIFGSRRKSILSWLQTLDTCREYTEDELMETFSNSFLAKTPEIFKLLNLDFFTISEEDLKKHLQALAKSKKIRLRTDPPHEK